MSPANPHPPTSREEIQEPFVRVMEIPTEEYYPEGYHPQLLPEWPPRPLSSDGPCEAADGLRESAELVSNAQVRDRCRAAIDDLERRDAD